MFAQTQLELAEYCAHLGGKRRSGPGLSRRFKIAHKVNISHIQVDCKDYLCMCSGGRPVHQPRRIILILDKLCPVNRGLIYRDERACV
jgi:hypothetical protein